MSYRLLSSRILPRLHASKIPQRFSSTLSKPIASTRTTTTAALAVFLAGTGLIVTSNDHHFPSATKCDTRRASKGSDAVMLAPKAEPVTGILFPRLCNGMTFVGCGVRIKWRFIKVYAAGTYIDPLSFSAVKKQGPDAINEALLDPKYPRTIRLVMNRNLSVEKFTSAIVESLEPRMKGEDLDKLEEFKKLNPPVDLIEGAIMEMTIRGDTMLYKNGVGQVGRIHSEVFCKAMCDVYFGKEAVSMDHKEDVIKGIEGL